MTDLFGSSSQWAGAQNLYGGAPSGNMINASGGVVSGSITTWGQLLNTYAPKFFNQYGGMFLSAVTLGRLFPLAYAYMYAPGKVNEALSDVKKFWSGTDTTNAIKLTGWFVSDAYRIAGLGAVKPTWSKPSSATASTSTVTRATLNASKPTGSRGISEYQRVTINRGRAGSSKDQFRVVVWNLGPFLRGPTLKDKQNTIYWSTTRALTESMVKSIMQGKAVSATTLNG